MTNSIFQNPKDKWTELLRDRPLKDLVDIDFPYALGTENMTNIRLVIAKILQATKLPGEPDVGPRIIIHLSHFLTTNPSIKNKKWRSIAGLLTAFVPPFFTYDKTAHEEPNIANVFSIWMNNFPRAAEALKEAESEPEKNAPFLKTIGNTLKLLSLKKSPQQLEWVSFLSVELKTDTAKEVLKHVQDDASFFLPNKPQLIIKNTENHFPELSEVVLQETKKTLQEHLRIVGSVGKLPSPQLSQFNPSAGVLDQLLQGLDQIINPPPFPPCQPGNLVKSFLGMGGLFKDFEKEGSLQKLSTTCFFIQKFCKENEKDLSGKWFHELFDFLEKHKELYPSLGELGQVAKSYSEKKNILKNIPEVTTKNPKQKNKL